MTNPDNNKKESGLLTDPIDLALELKDDTRDSKLIARMMRGPYATMSRNPVQYVNDLIWKPTFFVGNNLKSACADENGEIDPMKFLALAKDCYKRTYGWLHNDESRSFLMGSSEEGLTPDTLSASYAEILVKYCDMYGVGDAFRDFVKEFTAPKKQTEKPYKPVQSAEPEQTAPQKRYTQSWQTDASKRDAERGAVPSPGQMRIGDPNTPVVPGKRETLRPISPQKPAMVERRPTLQLVSRFEGEKHIAGYKPEAIDHEVIPHRRESSIPGREVIEELRKHPTLQGLPMPSISSMDSMPPIPGKSVPSKLMPGAGAAPADAETYETPSQPNMHAHNPPPPSMRGEIIPGQSNPPGVSARKTPASLNLPEYEPDDIEKADREFAQAVKTAYARMVISREDDESDQIDKDAIVKEILGSVLERAQKKDESENDPLRNFKNYYCHEDVDPSGREVLLTDMVRDIILPHADFMIAFIRAYRVFQLNNAVTDTIGARYMDPAVARVIDKLITGSKRTMPFFREAYLKDGAKPEDLKQMMCEMGNQVLLTDLPYYKAESYAQLKSGFIAAFEGNYPIKRKKIRKTGMFNRLLGATVKDLNASLKEDKEKNAEYCLYYPTEHLKEVEQRALGIAEEKAMQERKRLKVPIEHYLHEISGRFQQEALLAEGDELRKLRDQFNWNALCWLYKMLPREQGPRIWLNYFFKGQTNPEKLQDTDNDDKLEIIADQVLGEVKEYCEWIKTRHSLMNGTPSSPPQDVERFDIGEIVGDSGDATAQVEDLGTAQDSPLFAGIAETEETTGIYDATSKEPVKSVIISPEIDPASVRESVTERGARLKISDLGDIESAELEQYGMVQSGDWTIHKTKNGYAFEHADGTKHYENLPYSGQRPEDEELARQLADLATIGDEDEGDTPAYFEEQPGDASAVVAQVGGDIFRLDIPPEDRKAQEFSILVDHFARNTKLPVSRGPMGSMPPEKMSAEEAQAEAMKTDAEAPAPQEVVAPVISNEKSSETKLTMSEKTHDDTPVPAPVPVSRSWFKRTIGKVATVAAIAAGALGIYSAVKSTTDTTEAPQVASSVDTNKGPKVADSATTGIDTKTAPTTDNTPDTPDNTASPDKAADNLSITPEMIASVKSPGLKEMLESGEFTVKANGGGYGQQLRAPFDAEINAKVIAGEITAAEAVQMTKQIEELQNRVNTGAALSYYAKYKNLTYGEVYHKRANPGQDSLFSYLERYLGPWESWRAKFEPLTKLPNAQELRENFEKNYEGDMLSFGYDKHAKGNIHWGAHGGDIAKIRDGGRTLVYAAELAKIVLTPKERVEIDLDWDDSQNTGASNPVSKDMNMDNVAPTVEPADAGVDNGQTPDSGNGDSEGFSIPPKTGMLNRSEPYDDEPQIEVAWSDPEDPELEMGEAFEMDLSELEESPEEPAVRVASSTLSKEMEAELADLEDGWFTEPATIEQKEPSLEERIAAVKLDRRQALLERGEVFVPSLSEDLDGSVKLAFENGFMMMCTNGIQQDKVESLARNIRFSEMVEYTATDKGTYAKLSPEKLGQLRAALSLEQPAKNTPAVTVKSATYNEAIEAELAEIEAGWDTPMDVQQGVRENVAGTVADVMKKAA